MPAMPAPSPLSLPVDLSRLPQMQLVEVNHGLERDKTIAGVKARMKAWGFDFDVGRLASDPAVALIEEVAYRRALGLQTINDAGKQLTLVHSYGPYLDHIAATYYADVQAARLEGETDDRFLRRLLLAAHARSVGSLEGYEYWALTLAPALADARALNHSSGLVARGDIALVVAAAPGAVDEADQVEAVRVGLSARGRHHANDVLTVRAAVRRPYSVSATLLGRPGPDPAPVIAEAQARLQAFAADRRRVGRPITNSGLHAALTVAGVEGVRLAADMDIDPGPDGICELEAFGLFWDVMP